MKKLNVVTIFLLLSAFFNSCDIINSWFEEREEGPKESIEEYLQGNLIAEGNFRFDAFGVEDENSYSCDIDFPHGGEIDVDYENGVYHAYLTEQTGEDIIVRNLDLLMYFSSDRLYIDSMFLTYVYDEMNYLNEANRELTYTCEIYNPIPIVTPDLDSIWENGLLEYQQEFNNEKDSKSKLVEKLYNDSEFQYFTMQPIVDENNDLKVYLFFRIW